MCNLGTAVELKGIEKDDENRLLQDIKSLMETLKLTSQQAMDALKVPKEEQAHYKSKL